MSSPVEPPEQPPEGPPAHPPAHPPAQPPAHRPARPPAHPPEQPRGNHPVRLSELTTLRLGGPALDLITITDRDQLPAALDTGEVLVIGGGSNLVVADEGVPATVVKIAIPGICIDGDLVTIGAGVDWDAAVAELIDEGFCGLATLSGIPGSSGATPVQNVGAYGSEIADTLQRVTLFDRRTRRFRTAPKADLHLGYRSSELRGTDQAVIVDLTLRLPRSDQPVRYAELARTLQVAPGRTAPERDVRQAVLELRRSKGMVIDARDPDTRSAGSFFTNPILDREQMVRADAAIRQRLGNTIDYPNYPAGNDHRKLSAAWLIERAGFGKGYLGPGGRVAVSTKHTLALVNRGGSTADLLTLAREIQDTVLTTFAVRLHPEPVLVGTSISI